MDICRNVGDNDGLYTGRKGRDVFRKGRTGDGEIFNRYKGGRNG